MKVEKVDYIDNLSNLRCICEEELPHCDAFVTLISSWHFDNLLAIMDLKKLKNVFCVITPEFISSTCSKFRLTPEMIFLSLDNRFFHILFFTGNLSFSIYDQIKLVFRKRIPIIYICPGIRPNLKLLFALSIKPSKFLGIDEGLGTYISITEFRKSLPNRMRCGFLLMTIKDTLISLLNILLFSHMDSCYLFQKKQNGTLYINSLIASFLRNQYLKRIDRQVKKKERSVLVLIDNALVVKVCDILPLVYAITSLLPSNYAIFVKVHPNDSIDEFSCVSIKYPNVNFLDPIRSAESCVAEYNPQFLIGGYSTSLFVSSAIFGIKAISYMGLYLNEIPASTLYNNQIIYFMNAFGDNRLIKFPFTISNFLNEIKLISNEQ